VPELSFERAAVRISGPNGTVGTGFLVAEDLVCTCAHVVADALSADPTCRSRATSPATSRC
jgi:hypothetical protein